MINAIENVNEVIRNGHIVVIFPESTTSNGSYLDRFHSGLFESAVQSSVPVQPVSIQFKIAGTPDYDIAPYINNDNFIVHLVRFMKTPKNSVSIHYLKPISSIGMNRNTLCERSRRSIESDLFHSETLHQAA
jgi:1-acyl-sn-glycerol-3-phosphate acyltransferase